MLSASFSWLLSAASTCLSASLVTGPNTPAIPAAISSAAAAAGGSSSRLGAACSLPPESVMPAGWPEPPEVLGREEGLELGGGSDRMALELEGFEVSDRLKTGRPSTKDFDSAAGCERVSSFGSILGPDFETTPALGATEGTEEGAFAVGAVSVSLLANGALGMEGSWAVMVDQDGRNEGRDR